MIERTQEDVMKKWPADFAFPIVSIRCTTYNQEAYISKALDGFLMQETNFPFEIVVHDDASTDQTANIIKEYEAKYPQIIKPIYEIENQYSKRNGSLRKIVNKACKGKYVAYCEGDDYWIDKKKLQMQYDAMEEHPECSLCTHVVQCVSESGSSLQRQYPLKGEFKNNIIAQDDFAEVLLARTIYPFQTCSYFIKCSLLQENDVIWSFPANGDDKILRICLNNGKVYFINKIMSCYRTHSKGSWTCRNYRNKKLKQESLLDMLRLDEKFDEYSLYRFHDYIEEGKKRVQIKLLVCNEHYKDLFLPENRELIKQIYSTKDFVKFYILSKLPKFFADVFLKLLSLRGQLKRFFKEIWGKEHI